MSVDVTSPQPTMSFSKEGNTIRQIEQNLIEALAGSGRHDTFEHIAAYRRAFEGYIEVASAQAQPLLRKIYVAYEHVAIHQHKEAFDDVFRRLRDSEQHRKEQEKKLSDYRRQFESMKLEIGNLEREVNVRNELLSQISATYKINVSMVNWITGVESKLGQRTMAEIRTVQKRVTTAYGEAQRVAARGEEEGHFASQQQAEFTSQQAIQEMQAAEQAFADISQLKGIPAIELRAKNKDDGDRSPRRRSSVSVVERPAAVQNPSTPMDDTDLAEVYRLSQRVENIGVDLEANADQEGKASQPKPLWTANRSGEL